VDKKWIDREVFSIKNNTRTNRRKETE